MSVFFAQKLHSLRHGQQNFVKKLMNFKQLSPTSKKKGRGNTYIHKFANICHHQTTSSIHFYKIKTNKQKETNAQYIQQQI